MQTYCPTTPNYSSVYFSKVRAFSYKTIISSSKSLSYIVIFPTDSIYFANCLNDVTSFLEGYNSVSYVAFSCTGTLSLPLSFSTFSGKSTGLSFCRVAYPLVCLMSPHAQTQAMHSCQGSYRNDAKCLEVVSCLTTGDVSLCHLTSLQ